MGRTRTPIVPLAEEVINLVLVGLVNVDVDDLPVVNAVDVHASKLETRVASHDGFSENHGDTVPRDKPIKDFDLDGEATRARKQRLDSCDHRLASAMLTRE